MVYRKKHEACRIFGCNSYRAYIKLRGKWVAVGYFNTRCKRFNYEPDKNVNEILQEVNADTQRIDIIKSAHDLIRGKFDPEEMSRNFGVSVDENEQI